jgi:flagellar biosynthesis/type III secretory pathway chaperone
VVAVTLEKVLQEELTLFQDLLGLEEKTHRILVEGNVKELAALSLQKEALMHEVDRLEEERKKIIPEGMTLLEYTGERPLEGEKLQNLRSLLLQVLTSLRRMQKVNRHLIYHNLNFVKHVFEILFPQKGEVLYAPGGEIQQKGFLATGILDSNV